MLPVPFCIFFTWTQQATAGLCAHHGKYGSQCRSAATVHPQNNQAFIHNRIDIPSIFQLDSRFNNLRGLVAPLLSGKTTKDCRACPVKTILKSPSLRTNRTKYLSGASGKEANKHSTLCSPGCKSSSTANSVVVEELRKARSEVWVPMISSGAL